MEQVAFFFFSLDIEDNLNQSYYTTEIEDLNFVTSSVHQPMWGKDAAVTEFVRWSDLIFIVSLERYYLNFFGYPFC